MSPAVGGAGSKPSSGGSEFLNTSAHSATSTSGHSVHAPLRPTAAVADGGSGASISSGSSSSSMIGRKSGVAWTIPAVQGIHNDGLSSTGGTAQHSARSGTSIISGSGGMGADGRRTSLPDVHSAPPQSFHVGSSSTGASFGSGVSGAHVPYSSTLASVDKALAATASSIPSSSGRHVSVLTGSHPLRDTVHGHALTSAAGAMTSHAASSSVLGMPLPASASSGDTGTGSSSAASAAAAAPYPSISSDSNSNAIGSAFAGLVSSSSSAAPASPPRLGGLSFQTGLSSSSSSHSGIGAHRISLSSNSGIGASIANGAAAQPQSGLPDNKKKWEDPMAQLLLRTLVRSQARRSREAALARTMSAWRRHCYESRVQQLQAAVTAGTGSPPKPPQQHQVERQDAAVGDGDASGVFTPIRHAPGSGGGGGGGSQLRVNTNGLLLESRVPGSAVSSGAQQPPSFLSPAKPQTETLGTQTASLPEPAVSDEIASAAAIFEAKQQRRRGVRGCLRWIATQLLRLVLLWAVLALSRYTVLHHPGAIVKVVGRVAQTRDQLIAHPKGGGQIRPLLLKLPAFGVEQGCVSAGGYIFSVCDPRLRQQWLDAHPPPQPSPVQPQQEEEVESEEEGPIFRDAASGASEPSVSNTKDNVSGGGNASASVSAPEQKHSEMVPAAPAPLVIEMAVDPLCSNPLGCGYEEVAF